MSEWSNRDNDSFHYFRDHETSGAWGVRHAGGRVVAVGMDKADAAVYALFLSGKTEEAARARDHFKEG